jgi:uncharacterized protein (TIGR00730 family)
MKNICVYCASSTQIDQKYFQEAQKLGEIFAQEDINLIFGAGSVGLMGVLADSVIQNGGKATGVIPQFMVDENWHHTELTELIVTQTMHERKEIMAQMADAAVALPGGCGTMEELLEIITWKQLGIFTKPVVIVNIGGYYDALLEMLGKAIDGKFMRPEHESMWEVVSNARDVLPAIRNAKEWHTSARGFAAI